MSKARGIVIAIEIAVSLWLVVLLHQDRLWAAYTLWSPAPASSDLYLRIEPAPGLFMNESQARVSTDRVEVRVFAPARSEVVVSQNGMFQSQMRLEDETTYRVPLSLRRGINSVVAEFMAQNEVPDRIFRDRAKLEIVRIPERPLTPVIIGIAPEGMRYVYGLGEPLWLLETCVFDGSRFRRELITTDEVGAFFIYASKPDERVRYRLVGPRDPSVAVGRTAQEELECLATDYPLTLTSTSGADTASLDRNLAIEIQESSVRVQASVKLPPESAIVEWIRYGLLSPQEFAWRLFGLGLQARPAVPSDHDSAIITRFDEVTRMEHVEVDFTVPARGFRFEPVLLSMMSQTGDRVEIVMSPDAPIRLGAQVPARSESAGRVKLVWDKPTRTLGWLASLGTERTTLSAEARDAPKATDEQTRQTSAFTAVQRLREVLPNWAYDTGYWLVAAIPFVWFLSIKRRSLGASPSEHSSMSKLVAGLLMFHFAYVIVFAFNFNLYRLVAPLMATGKFGDASLARDVLSGLGGLFPVATFAAAILFLSIDRWLPDGQAESGLASERGWLVARLFIVWPLAIAVIAIVVGGPFLMGKLASEFPAPWQGRWRQLASIAVGLTALLFGWIFVYWFLRTTIRRRISFSLAWLVSWSLLLIPAAPVLADSGLSLLRQSMLDRGLSPFLLRSSVSDLVWTFLCLLMGMALAYGLTRRVATIVGWSPMADWHAPTRRLIAIAVLFTVALPVFGTSDHSSQWVFVRYFYYVLRLAPFLLLVCVWILLRRENPQDSFELTATEANLGALLFAFYLCGGATNLLLIPIPMLVGYYLMTRYLLVLERKSLTVRALRAPALGRLVALKEAQRLLAAFRRHAEKKYAEGGLSRADYEKGLALAQERIHATRRALGMGERDARREIFGAGPEDGPLQNARCAVRRSIPLVVLFQVAAVDRALQRDVDSFPLLEVITPLVASAGYWLVAAFVFGYFYHCLRGFDGPSKGSAFAISLLLPTLSIIVLNQQPILATSAGEQLLRIGLFVFYLALTFDARVVWSSGFELRQLVLVYGIAPSLAFASSLAALGGLSFGPVLKVAGCWSLRLLGIESCTP